MTRRLSLVGIILAISSAFATTVQARPGDRYTLEFAILPSVVLVNEPYVGQLDYPDHRPGEPENYELTSTPIDVTQLRATLWLHSALIFDIAALSIRNREAWDSQKDDNRRLYEAGISYDFGSGDSRIRPFAGGLAGIINSQYYGVRRYLGAQGGVRFFVKDRAALRCLIAYRNALADSLEDFRAVQVAAGIGFFL